MDLSSISYIPKKRRKAGRIISILIVVFVILITAIVGFSLGAVFSIIYPEKLEVESFSQNIAPDYQDITISLDEESILIKGWLFYRGSNEKTIILSHDYGYNRLQFGADTIKLVKSLIDNGYDVLMFDYRNHGYSEGKVSSLGFSEKRDLNAAVEYMKNRGYKEINILGFGMGAITAIEMIEDRDDINKVIADSPDRNFDEYLERHIAVTKINRIYPLKRTIPFIVKVFTESVKIKSDTFENIEDILPGKIMFIHGGSDSFIDKSISKKYFTKITEKNPYNARYLEIEGAEYLEGYTKNPELYLSEIIDFLNNY